MLLCVKVSYTAAVSLLVVTFTGIIAQRGGGTLRVAL